METPSRPSVGGPALWAIVAVAALSLASLLSLPWFVTELWWFRSLGLEDLFIRRVLLRVGLFLLGFALAFGALWACAGELRSRRGALIGITVVSAFKAFHLSRLWLALPLAFSAVPLGAKDPLFHLDAGFYVFVVPALEGLLGWFTGLFWLCVLCAVGSMLDMGAKGGIGGLRDGLLSRRWLLLFGLLLWAISSGMDVLSLVLRGGRLIKGASFVDVWVRLPLMALKGLATLALAVPLIRRRSGALHGLRAWLALLAGTWLLCGLLPGVVQTLWVRPNEFQLERPYIASHLDMTIKAYGLDEAKVLHVTPSPKVSPEDVSKEAIRDIRLWDYAPLLSAYKQLQEIRSYYEFLGVDVDRYVTPEGQRQVMLAVRELDHRNLRGQTWVNRHLEFTHGYGLVMNYVNQVQPGGLPLMIIKDIPPSGGPVEVAVPQIYYGEMDYPYGLVKTNVEEFDYPSGDSNVRSVYDGSGGVPVGSLPRRLLFALRFMDPELIFTRALTDESRIMFNRNIISMASRIAPFLWFDSDPYPVVHKGRVVWMLDGYLTSRMFPYSMPVKLDPGRKFNYIRNVVKVTVDAFDGTIKFYAMDERALAPYVSLFPGLFLPISTMPEGLRVHIRYPKDLFRVQAQVFRTYHVKDPNTFYNREDLWMISSSGPGGSRSSNPNYVTMDLGEGKLEFVLVVPFSPEGRNNLVAWMAARCDGDRYGEMVVYKYPKRNLVFGPAQVEALIDQNPEISAQLSLWSQRGSDVIRGDMLVLPMGRSILYVEPLYLKAESGELPELKRVVLSSGGQVVWGQTLEEALNRLLGQEGGLPSSDVSSRVKAPHAAAFQTGSLLKDALPLLRKAREALERGKRRLGDYDFAGYGDAMMELEEALSEVQRILGGGGAP